MTKRWRMGVSILLAILTGSLSATALADLHPIDDDIRFVGQMEEDPTAIHPGMKYRYARDFRFKIETDDKYGLFAIKAFAMSCPQSSLSTRFFSILDHQRVITIHTDNIQPPQTAALGILAPGEYTVSFQIAGPEPCLIANGRIRFEMRDDPFNPPPPPPPPVDVFPISSEYDLIWRWMGYVEGENTAIEMVLPVREPAKGLESGVLACFDRAMPGLQATSNRAGDRDNADVLTVREDQAEPGRLGHCYRVGPVNLPDAYGRVVKFFTDPDGRKVWFEVNPVRNLDRLDERGIYFAPAVDQYAAVVQIPTEYPGPATKEAYVCLNTRRAPDSIELLGPSGAVLNAAATPFGRHCHQLRSLELQADTSYMVRIKLGETTLEVPLAN